MWKLSRRKLFLFMITGVVFATTLVFGSYISVDMGIPYNDISIYGKIAGIAILIAVLCPFVAHFCGRAIENIQRWDENSRLCSKVRECGCCFLFFWLFLFLAWLPGLLAAYPGIVSYDCGMQTLWALVLNVYNNHHPVMHTMLIDVFLTASENLTGEYTLGVLGYSLLQTAVLSGACACLAAHLKKWGVPIIVCLATLSGFAFLPLNAMWAVCMTKDTIFAAMFLVTLCYLAELAMFPDSFFSTLKKTNILAVAGFLMCAFRNTGIYIWIFTGIFFVIFLKGYRIKVLNIFIGLVVLFGIYTGPFFGMLAVEPGDAREALSVPVQQMARTMVEHRDSMTEEERQMLKTYIPGYEGYNPRLADPVKFSFVTEAMQEDVGQFLKLYLSLGRQYPGSYLDAFFAESYGFWYVGNRNGKEIYSQNYFEYDNFTWDYSPVVIERQSKLPKLDAWYREIGLEASYESVPLMGLFFNQGYCFFYLWIGILVLVYKRQYRLLLMAVPLIGLFGTMLLSPIALLRYAYPLMISFPIFCVGVFREGKGRNS